MKTHATAVLVVGLLLTPIAFSIGTVFLLPLALVLFPFLLILGAAALFVLSSPGFGHIVVPRSRPLLR
jgi:hypothetical protein